MFAKLKRALTVALLVALAIVPSACSPDFTDVQGRHFDWEDYRGKWLVLNYWANWCAPCIEEIPELNRLHREHSDERAQVLGINFDWPALDELKRQMTALDVRFPVLFADPDNKLGYLLPESLPTTYLFGPDGQLRHKLVGPQTQADIEALIFEVDGR